jgi:hypothetical protein
MQEKQDEMFEQGMITTAHPKISASGFISWRGPPLYHSTYCFVTWAVGCNLADEQKQPSVCQ